MRIRIPRQWVCCLAVEHGLPGSPCRNSELGEDGPGYGGLDANVCPTVCPLARSAAQARKQPLDSGLSLRHIRRTQQVRYVAQARVAAAVLPGFLGASTPELRASRKRNAHKCPVPAAHTVSSTVCPTVCPVRAGAVFDDAAGPSIRRQLRGHRLISLMHVRSRLRHPS